jgi:hypothetical protein
MKKLAILATALFSTFSQAGEWVTLEAKDFLQVEIAQAGALSFAAEGVYFKHKTTFNTSVSCSKKQFVVITDPKLADRALSVAMFASATSKTLQFYVDGCNNQYLHGKIVMMKP